MRRYGNETKWCTYIVNKILMRRSQLQPVMKAAAAGGKRIATCVEYHRHQMGE